MTVLAAVLGGTDVLVLASDSCAAIEDDDGRRVAAAGGIHDLPDFLHSKLHSLSARYPIAAGTVGLAGNENWGPELSVHGAMARCRARFDGEDLEAPAWAPALTPAYTMRDVAALVAREVYLTLGWALKDRARRPEPEGVPPGGWRGDTSICGLVAGYSGDTGRSEAWFFRVSDAGVVARELKTYGGPNRWGVAITPGADAAYAARTRVIGGRVPRSLEHAAGMAQGIIEAQIAAYALDPTVLTARGPVQALGLTPGAPPRILDAEPAAC